MTEEDEMGEDTVTLTARGDGRWEEAIFFFQNMQMGLTAVSLTESNFRKLFLCGKKKDVISFTRNISILFEDSLILTHYLSNL